MYKRQKEDLKGATGATGKGVSAITPQYYLSTSNTTQSGGSWSNTRPSWVAGRYYWMRDYIQWTDGSVTASAPQLATDLNNLYSSLQTVTNTVSSQGTQLSTCLLYTSMGITGQAALDMAEDVTGLTGDVASFYNLSTDEAYKMCIRDRNTKIAGYNAEATPLTGVNPVHTIQFGICITGRKNSDTPETVETKVVKDAESLSVSVDRCV